MIEKLASTSLASAYGPSTATGTLSCRRTVRVNAGSPSPTVETSSPVAASSLPRSS
jgi:hypothetical protein